MRKQDVILGVFLLLALAACHAPRREARQMPTAAPGLAAIDSLSWAQPDSALALLLPWLDSVQANETFDRHYAHLLLSELLYKNDYAQTNREELQQAVAFFDSLVADTRCASVPVLAARSHYINGVGFYEEDSILRACKEYMKAVEIMEMGFDEKELVGEKARFMALTYTHLTGLFSDQYLHEQAIYFGKEALRYYGRYDAIPWHKAWMLNEIGSHYDMMDSYDSAAFYYHKGLAVLSDTNSLMYRDVSTHLAYLSYKKDKDVQGTLNHLHSLIMDAESEKEYLARCLTFGEVFYHEKQLDSAQVYLNLVFHHSQSVGARKQAAEWLTDICKIQGRDSEILEYATFIVPFANQNENQSHLKSQLTKAFHDFGLEKAEIRHRRLMRKYVRYGGMVLAALATLSAVFVALHFVHKKRHKHLKSQKEAVEKQLETEQYAHEIQQKALAGKLRKSNESLRQLGNILVSRNAMRGETKSLSDFAAFKESPVCSHILEVVDDRNFKPKIDCVFYKDYALDRKQLKALMDAADQHLDRFTVRVQTLYPRLTDDDMKYCCLYLLGLNEADISALMQRAYTTVCERNRKIKRILGTQGELSAALRELV